MMSVRFSRAFQARALVVSIVGGLVSRIYVFAFGLGPFLFGPFLCFAGHADL